MFVLQTLFQWKGFVLIFNLVVQLKQIHPINDLSKIVFFVVSVLNKFLLTIQERKFQRDNRCQNALSTFEICSHVFCTSKLTNSFELLTEIIYIKSQWTYQYKTQFNTNIGSFITALVSKTLFESKYFSSNVTNYDS